MKKKYIAALLLGSSFFLLTGFDSKLTPQEILDASAEAMSEIGELNSVNGKIECRMKTEVSLSSEDGSIPESSTTVLNKISGDFTVLDDSSLGMDIQWKIVFPGTQDTLGLRFYRFWGRDGFQNYFYDSVDDIWMKAAFPEELDMRLEEYVQYAFSTFAGMGTSGFLPEGRLNIEDFLEDLPESPYSGPEMKEWEEMYKQMVSAMEIEAGRVSVSPVPTEIDGASCYKLEQTVSYNVDGDGVAEMLEFYLKGNEASSAEPYADIDEEVRLFSDMIGDILDDIPMTTCYYIDDTTFLPVKRTEDMSGIEISFSLHEFAQMYEENEMYGMEAPIPNIGISFPEYKMEISYKLNETDEIKIPSDALYAQRIDLEPDTEIE